MADQELEFTWDDDKAAANLEKHGISFAVAAAVFDYETIERIDDREEYGEVRWIALGRYGTEIYRVTYTWRERSLIRIISAQKASSDERKIYYREVFQE